MAVYLLHFDRKLHHAGHYLGWTPAEVWRRLELHHNGQGARLVSVIRAAGIDFRLARTWPEGDRALERKLKRRHNGRRLCPICKREARACAS